MGNTVQRNIINESCKTFDKSEKSSQSYNFIDCVKFICALLVIAIHVPPLTGIHWILNFGVVNFISRIAVPFFFVSSAYFVFKKAYKNPEKELNQDVILKYIRKIFRLYVIWSVIYAPFAYYHMSETLGRLTALQFLKSYALQFVFSASYGHLWYLNAVIFAYLFILLMFAVKIKPAVIAAFAMIMYCVGLCTQSWFGLVKPLSRFAHFWSFFLFLEKIFVSSRNGLCEGLIFVMIGRFFATHEMKMKTKTAMICLVGSFVLLAAEVFILTRIDWIRGYDIYLSIIPTVFFLFYVSLNIKLPERAVYKKLRTLSALIYFSHMLFVEFLILVPYFEKMSIGGLPRYIFTFLASLIFSAGIVKLSERFKVLRYLYK